MKLTEMEQFVLEQMVVYSEAANPDIEDVRAQIEGNVQRESSGRDGVVALQCGRIVGYGFEGSALSHYEEMCKLAIDGRLSSVGLLAGKFEHSVSYGDIGGILHLVTVAKSAARY